MERKPNLLFLLTDQQRVDTMRCYGNEQIQTQSLNALADESFVFENAYVSQPVCSPARATILTGLYPHTVRVPACNIPLPTETKTIAELVSDDYRCAYFGKWHLGDEIFPQHGFTEWVGTEDSYRRFYSKPDLLYQLSDYHHFLVANDFSPEAESMGQKVFSRHVAASMEEPFTKAAFLGDMAAEFIKTNSNNPFMLFVSYLEPHPPHTGPFNEMYDSSSLPVGPHFMRKPPPNASLLNRLMSAYYMESEEYGYDLRTEEGWRHVRARYWGNITLVDHSMGKILRALEESGLENNTIVVFTSEHGEMIGDHGILGKTVMYEEAIKVPLIIRVPWLGKQARWIRGNFSQIDLVPTLLSLMGETTPDNLQGENRVDVLHEEKLLSDDVFVQWNRSDGHPLPGEAEVNPALTQPWRTIISADRWKLNLSAHDKCELYDLNADPFEMVNLFDQPEHRARIRHLAAQIRQCQKRTGDKILC